MGLWNRIRTLFGAKVNSALDRMENPAETLDYSYEKQLGLLRDVKRGLADIATAKQRLKLQADKLRQEEARLDRQARQALAQGREDLARVALQRKSGLQPQLQSLTTQVDQLDDQQARLAEASQKLQTRIEMFRTQKEALKAQYVASSAQVKIGESFTGLSREMNDIGMAVERTQNRIDQMQARSGALDELVDSGALDDYTSRLGGGDYIDRQLAAGAGSDVDRQLEELKAQLGVRQIPQIESQD